MRDNKKTNYCSICLQVMSLDDMEGALLPLLLAKATTSGLPLVIFLVSTTHKSSDRFFFFCVGGQPGATLQDVYRGRQLGDRHIAPAL